jgi:hypothetical protein
MTTADQLEGWARQNIDDGRRAEFVGVYMSDQLADASAALRKSSAHTRSLIFNYDPAGKPGSHWVGVRITPSKLEWFDSYGQRPDADDGVLRDRTGFRAWCEKNSPRGYFLWNSLDFQALDSAVCGQYALFFCKNGLPDASNPAWKPFRQLPWTTPESRGIKGLPSVNQEAAKARDDLIRELVRL